MTVQISICVTDFPEVSTTACQHYSLITLQRFVPRRLVNARQKFLHFWSSVQLTCGSNNSLLCFSLQQRFCGFFNVNIEYVSAPFIKEIAQHFRNYVYFSPL